MDPVFAVQRSLAAFSAVRPGDWGALEAAIRKAGVPAGLAAEVIAFAPIAFGRVLMDGMEIEFAPEYATPGTAAQGRTAGVLLEHPVYAGALTLSIGMSAGQDAGESFVNVAVWSSEFSAVNQALNAGSNPADLVAGPPLISGLPGDGSARATTEEAGKRPWWRVWG